ncbi:aldo/keto reductase [Rhizobium lentis]|uniref:Aryl-alcohol dehydrogenase-like predicted oxidoreductase n=1 Tax=Rhizobium lentis TaxID=1138194 RepID=A0A7W8ULL3_9HYPH|nr:aldo/keto reductase [Rhizobium lentis]MBB4573815.1 aryl-alcohol dehydrogenase-like predicted oxidoreductase [Rhizobium lentis]MBB5549743.1 aryl-alcohol dehydrogenase-like predicted oxidoreductase [Rhizobium lentis]MBB5560249.1 aryl-alcohol dehydrogenase-like predicted oxidoreductase [Rhizobium lentis]MBB5566863.1 aryl-alcohol dehydrogenase-like predicted oxidoreductase [Rhizobium lentis]
MKYKSLGRTDISVSEICLGTMTWGSQNSETDAHAQMDYAVEKGVNFFDTAELYPTTPVSPETQGWTEDYIGSWFSKSGKRSDIVLATKVAGRGRDYLRGGEGANAKNVRLALEASLKRLQTDYVDLYQVHWPNRGHFHFRQNWGYNPFTQDREKAVANMLEILETLGALVKEGKIRAIGLSNETTWGIQKYLTLSEQKSLPRVASVQNEYNLLYRHFDLDLAELSHHEDVGLLAYSPLAGGILTGKYVDGGRPKGSRASINPDIGGRLQPLQEPATKAYLEIAVRYGLDPAAMALAFCLSRPFMTSVIIGATSMKQLDTDLSSVNLKLSIEVLAEIEKVHRQYPMPM